MVTATPCGDNISLERYSLKVYGNRSELNSYHNLWSRESCYNGTEHGNKNDPHHYATPDQTRCPLEKTQTYQ